MTLAAATPVLPAPTWDALPGMVLVFDTRAEALYANAALAVWARQSPQSLAGTGWRSAFAPLSAQWLEAAVRRGEPFHLRMEGRGDGDGPTWIDCEARWLAEGAGCICLLHDVTPAVRAQAAAADQAGLFRLLADNVPVLIAYFRQSDNTCHFANKQYARTFGRTEQEIIGLTVEQVIGEEAARQIQPQVDVVIRERRAVQYERQLGTPTAPQWIEVHLLPHFGAEGTVIGAFVLISDISKHRVAERAVRESEDRLAKFMQASVEGIVFHKDGVIVDANPPICALTGFPLEELLGRRTLEFIAPDEVAKVTSVLVSGQETTYESVLIDKHGQRIPVEFIVRTMLRNGERLRMTIVRDIRDRRAAQARIHHLAHHDPLTGLPNRMALMNQIEAQITTARADGGSFALLFIDLDHFKRVNDSLGHLAGDTLLRTTAARIVGALRATDIVARFGGDEFIVLLPALGPDAACRPHAQDVAQKLLRAVEAPLAAESRPISVTPSIGIALYPVDGDTPDELVKHADTAMYLAKSRGRANFQFFDRGLAGTAYAALVLEGELAHALTHGEFLLHFQPQVRASDGVLVGIEALLRWNHPQRGMRPPDEFIPVAERQRLMLPIGHWVLGEALAAARRWRAAGLPAAPVAVNLSTVQFEAPAFIETIAALLGDDDGTLLELEITERMLVDDLPSVTGKLARLQAMGVRISVDDFGTGYSSLGHLKHLPIDTLKIDRSFVHDLPAHGDSAAIARAIIQMGRSLGLEVVAEGVETEGQRRFLAEQGCDALQGVLISPPLPEDRFVAWLEARRA
jgi:diguanylate cyclase (GGDEF)-like protein/PAS domain S-box-containing protein